MMMAVLVVVVTCEEQERTFNWCPVNILDKPKPINVTYLILE